MKIERWAYIMLAAMVAITGVACGEDEDEPGAQNIGGSGGNDPGTGGTGGDGGSGHRDEIVEVNSDVTSDTTWTADKTWLLKKQVFVKNGATLEIEAGTRILGEFGTALIVTRGAKIHADGTADRPIVFTSAKEPGKRAPGDWGGVILLGRAPINSDGGENTIEGFPASQGADITYGGNDPEDSSGVLRFVRIEFAGWEYAPDEEINSLTLGGVGSGTVIEYIQTHMGADDGIEFFGGTANAKYLVVTRMDDDSIDWDLGYTGKIQFAVIQKEPLVGNNGYEADNDGSNMDKQPRSNPTIYNVTMIGSGVGPGEAGKDQIGMTLREGTAGTLMNHIVMGFPDFAVDIQHDATVAQFEAGNLRIENSIFWSNVGGDDWNNPAIDKAEADGGFDEGARIGGHPSNRSVDPQLVDPYNLVSPNFLPKPGSPVFEGGATPPDDGFFDPTATFVGAFGTEDWTRGWTAYPEN